MHLNIFKNLLVLLIILPLISFSKEVSKEDAKKLARNFYFEKSFIKSKLSFQESYSVSKQQKLLYYVFNINNGYIIVTADDRIQPIIAYSFTSAYSEENQPPVFQWWMDNVQGQILSALNDNIIPTEEIKATWHKYLDNNFIPIISKDEVTPLMYLHWGQGCYYNEDFPEDENGPCNHTYVGCVATAMAQIIKHYNFPKQGTGTHGYNSTYGWLEVDFGNTYYDWTSMSYKLESHNTAVAELAYHSAVSINTIFLQGGSGAFDFDMRDALVNYFNYSEDAQFILRDNYSGDWLALLRNELDANRPVLYGGADSTYYAGHTLVCDGYQDSTFFHFNWGWDGQFDGYFNVDELSANGYLFNYQQDVVVGIQPNLEVTPELYPPENITASSFMDTVILTWTPPTWAGNLEFLGYNICRDGQVINSEIIIDLDYYDMGVPSGDYNYYLTSVFIGAESGYSENIQVEVEGIGVSEPRNNQVQVYPNPVKDFIEISGLDFLDNELIISIIEYNGSAVLTEKINRQNREDIKINLQGLSGAFLLRIESGNQSFTQKIIVLK